MRAFVLALLLTATAFGQYEVTNFGGPWLPAVHAVSVGANAFTYSQNYFADPGEEKIPGYRLARRGVTKALASSLGTGPVLAQKELWHEGDSVAVVFFQGGDWYYSNYAKVKYGKSNWYEGGGYDNRSYDADYTLNTPRLIRPFSKSTVDVVEGQDSLKADNENASLFFRFAAPGDTVEIDTGANGSWDWKFVVRRVLTNNRLIFDSLGVDIKTAGNCNYRLKRPFSTTSIPDIEVYDRRAYVTNAVNPMQVIFFYDSVLYLREVHTAQRVPINDVQGWFNDTLNEWMSPESWRPGYHNDSIDFDNLRFTRIYSWSKAWQPGEWSGGLTAGPTDLYFFRFGNNSGAVTPRQSRIRIVPVFYNDENSLVLLNPLLGERDTVFRSVSLFQNYYPYHDENDSTSYHAMLTANVVGHEGYILSMAGNLETVLARSVTGTIKAVGNASMWVSQDADVRALIPSGGVGLNDAIYFIHSLNPEQNKNHTIITNQKFSYKTFYGNTLPQPLPSGWFIVSWHTYGGTKGDENTKYTPIPHDQWNKRGFGNPEDVIKVKIPGIDTTQIAVSSREFYPIRYAVTDDTAGTDDSTIFITTNQPAIIDTPRVLDTVTVTDWELVRAEVPRFAGLEAHNRIGLVGFGDTTDQGLLSRSAMTIRGPEPENWSPAHDVHISDTYDPVVGVESNNDFETVFTTNQIFGAQVTGEGFWTYEELTQNLGCVAPRSIIALNDRIYFRGNDGFYEISRRDLSGFQVRKISDQIKSVLSSIDLSAGFGHDGTHLEENRSRLGLEIGVWDSREERIWWFTAMGSSNYPNYALTYSPGTGLWDGVQTLGAASAISLKLRDTMQLLLGDPSRGMLAWANMGVTDSGRAITTALESTIYSVFGDTVRARPERMTLTYSNDAVQTAATDTTLWIMASLVATDFAAGIDTAIRVTPGSPPFRTAVDRYLLDDVGSSVFWRWRLEHRGDTASGDVLGRFQPLRMNVSFIPSGTGD